MRGSQGNRPAIAFPLVGVEPFSRLLMAAKFTAQRILLSQLPSINATERDRSALPGRRISGMTWSSHVAVSNLKAAVSSNATNHESATHKLRLSCTGCRSHHKPDVLPKSFKSCGQASINTLLGSIQRQITTQRIF